MRARRAHERIGIVVAVVQRPIRVMVAVGKLGRVGWHGERVTRSLRCVGRVNTYSTKAGKRLFTLARKGRGSLHPVA